MYIRKLDELDFNVPLRFASLHHMIEVRLKCLERYLLGIGSAKRCRVTWWEPNQLKFEPAKIRFELSSYS